MVRSLGVAAATAFSAALGVSAAPRTWEEAIEKATEVMPRINWKDRRAFLHGIKVGEEGKGTDVDVPSHKGYTRRIKDLHVPGLKFEDGPSGYHTLDEVVGSATCFPSLLALASTWDTQLAQAFGAAIGTEFKGKGANVLLGPTLNVHRSPNDGRNVLSLSGEDPYLGASLAREYISGVHSQGVIAAPKSMAYYETKAPLASIMVADSTAWQLYYPPFEAAVQAGAVAMTCPGNSVNGQAACGSQRMLSEDLRGKMGFKGFVLSDWGATTSPAGMAMGGVKMIMNGLDLEMPVEALLSKTGLFFADKKGAGGTQTAFDQGVMHMLSAVFKMGLDSEEGCAGPHKCYEALLTNVTSSQHVSLARTVATEAVTLLKNDGVLPLDPSRVKKIAVVGPAAVQVQDVSAAAYQKADYYSAGGAEHCRTSAVVTPLAALSSYAAQRGIEAESTGASDPMDMLYTIHSADVVIVVAAATSTADGPRSSMNLDGEMDRLISQVAKSKTTVVLMQTPGAVLTPWRDEVSAIANLFLAGQETGSAWAAVVFGEAEPAGRLPVAFPAEQKGLLVGADPSFVRYDEGLFTSYRAGTQQAAFPFGHGLSYTNFSYGIPELRADCSAKVCVSMRVKNTGARNGREVAQAYLEFPSAAAMPRKLLRGFKKTKTLRPQESEELVFAFTERDLSTYSNGAWLAWDGIVARFGASSEDFRQQLTLSQPGAAQMAAAPAEETKAQASGPAAARGQLEVSKALTAEPATLRAVIPEKPKVPRRFAPPPTPPRRESKADEASTIQQPMLRKVPVARHA